MKKIKVLLAVLAICVLSLSPMLQGITASAAEEAKSYTVMDFILLSRYLVENSSYNSDFDYNKDNKVDVKDTVALKKLILNLPYSPIIPDDDKDDSEFDDDGYYNDVIKP